MSDRRSDAPACLRTRRMLDGWLDGELDPATGGEIARHVSQCPDCLALRGERERLRETLRAAAPRLTAPQELRDAVMRRLRVKHAGPGVDPPVPVRRPAARLLSWWQALALAGAASAAAAVLTAVLMHLPADDLAQESPREQAVTHHVASLAGARLIDVASSDSHVVKPWFQGKIDFAPMVRDLSAQGFVLLGARQERIAGRPLGGGGLQDTKSPGEPVHLASAWGTRGRVEPLDGARLRRRRLGRGRT